MAVQNRETLINYFKAGMRPTGQHFKDLIESMVHSEDESYVKSRDSVIEVAPLDEVREVISILNNPGDAAPGWTVTLEKSGDLSICGLKGEGQDPASITLKATGGIRLHGNNITIDGTRSGTMVQVPADGRWHTVAEALGGVNTIEITAAYQNNSGKYNTLLGWASHCFGRRRKIKRIRPRTFFWQNKVRLRWLRVKDDSGKRTLCDLQVKTRYKTSGGSIKCSLTQLWNRHDIF